MHSTHVPHPSAELRSRGLSIRYSLPLLISVLAAVVIAVYAAAAYRVMQTSALDAAAERLKGVTQELSAMLADVAPPLLAEADAHASSGAVRRFLRDPAAGDAERTLAAIAVSGNTLGRELRDRSGRRVLATHDGLPGGAEPDPALAALIARAEDGAIGPIRAVGDSLVAPVAAAVKAGSSTLGYVVTWRRLSGSGRDQIEQLIGSNAQMYLANESGDLWTDLAQPVAAGPVRPDTSGVIEYARPGEGVQLAAAAAVPGTPWVVVTEFPRALVGARARSLLRTLALLGLVSLVLAAAATWLLAGRFTAPIMELAETARALSAGDYNRRSTLARGDELGTLGRSFNSMAESVSFAHRSLELQVAQLAEMEARNREVGNRLQHVLSSSPDIIYELDMSGAEPAFTWVSENVERLLGYTIAEVMAPGWWRDHVEPDRAEPHVQPRREFGVEGETTREYRLRHRDGRYRWIRDRQRLVGDGTTIVGVWSDVTELRTLEEQFRQAQKLEAIGRLAGGIAHDFNNIVTVILGESDMALSALPPASPVRDSLDQIRTAGERASLLTRQLLTFSRKQLTETGVFSLNELVIDMEDMLRRLIGEDVELRIRPALELAHVNADRGQIEQVLVNLVINARDAMPDGGIIAVETHGVVLDSDYLRTRPGAAGTGEFVALIVSDTGTGMTEEVRAHLFEPFFTTKPPGKGTGLGLATCYGIARQFGGHIGVYSEPGVGTTMKLYLPRSRSMESEHVLSRTPEVLPRGDETILLVEDEAQVRAIVARMLKAQGYRVILANNGLEALERIENDGGHIDLLLTDIVMPQMGGRELAERVRTLRPRLKVLFTSGYTEDVIMQNRLTDRDIVLLQKPFTRAALAGKVRETLDAPITSA